MTTQTEAQRLAFALDGHDGALWVNEAAAELRRLEAANAELLEALKDMAEHSGCAHLDKARAAIKKHGGAA